MSLLKRLHGRAGRQAGGSADFKACLVLGGHLAREYWHCQADSQEARLRLDSGRRHVLDMESAKGSCMKNMYHTADYMFTGNSYTHTTWPWPSSPGLSPRPPCCKTMFHRYPAWCRTGRNKEKNVPRPPWPRAGRHHPTSDDIVQITCVYKFTPSVKQQSQRPGG